MATPFCANPCIGSALSESVCASGSRVRLQRNQRVWSRGDRADHLLILCGGMTAESNVTPTGQQHIVKIASRGTVIGMTEGMEPGVRESDVDVMMSGAAVTVPFDSIKALVERGGRDALSFTTLAVRCGHTMARRVREVGYGTVEERLARIILHFADTSGLTDARGVLIPIQMSRTRLAVLLGCRLETLVRVLRREDIQGMIAFVREGILVRDVLQVRRLAER